MTAKTKKVKSIYSTAVSHLEKKTFADSGQSYIAKKTAAEQKERRGDLDKKRAHNSNIPSKNFRLFSV